MASEVNNGFVINLSSIDRKQIDSSVDLLVKTIVSSGATVKGPFLRKNFVKEGVVYHCRKINVIDPTADTASALETLNLSKDVTIKLFRD